MCKIITAITLPVSDHRLNRVIRHECVSGFTMFSVQYAAHTSLCVAQQVLSLKNRVNECP